MHATRFTVNGRDVEARVDADKPLLWVLRDELKLKGTKYGCGVGLCGICTVLIDDEPHHACMVPAHKLASRRVVTVEGLHDVNPHLQAAWIQAQAPQCGYCQPGQLMAAAALLRRNPRPGTAEIDAALAGVLCRCGTYQRLRHALQLALRDDAHATAAPALPPPPDRGVVLDPFLRVHADDSITLQINHTEMGQGALTALVMLAAEELEVDVARIRTEFAPADPAYENPPWGSQFTGGSSTVRGEWTALRQRAAAVRARLLLAAARRWDVAVERCRAEGGAIHHDGAQFTYAQLAPDAARLPAPRNVHLKEPEEFRVLGRATARRDIPDMVSGRTLYAIDLEVPDLRVATVLRCPVFGGKVREVDDSAARAVPGVQAVVRIDGGVAVVADNFWNAWRGREALRVRWTPPARARVNSADVYAELAHATQRKGRVVNQTGDAHRALKNAARVIRADYRTPYLAHVPLEPLNCIADVRADRCDVWVGTQSQVDTQAVAARRAGLSREKVFVHSQFCGGGFGRRLETDFVDEAVQLSQALRQPVQVIWTRGDDLQHDRYRPADHVYCEAALDAGGWPDAWSMRVAGPPAALDGTDVPYAIANFREEHCMVESALPTGAWRSVGASQNCFAIESFIDELAHAAGADPVDYRRRLLARDARLRGVLDAAAQHAAWDNALPARQGRGVAVYHGFGSYTAVVAQVDATDAPRVTHIVCAIDCGMTVNPDAVRAQVEGGVAFALSAALREEIRVADGAVTQATFADYPILTCAEMPQVDVHVLQSRDAPGGVGEPPVPPVAPAVANAIYAATGRRVRRLPLIPAFYETT